MIRRLLQVAGATAVLVAPLAVFAQTVTTAPLTRSTPALSLPVLSLLVVVLLGVAAYSMRTRVARNTMAALVVATGLTAWAVVSFAIMPAMGVNVLGDDCNKITTQTYNVSAPVIKSGCPNPIEIVSFDAGCAHDTLPEVLGPSNCTVGLILNFGESCTLPTCSPC